MCVCMCVCVCVCVCVCLQWGTHRQQLAMATFFFLKILLPRDLELRREGGIERESVKGKETARIDRTFANKISHGYILNIRMQDFTVSDKICKTTEAKSRECKVHGSHSGQRPAASELPSGLLKLHPRAFSKLKYAH